MEFLDYYLHAAGAALGMEEAARRRRAARGVDRLPPCRRRTWRTGKPAVVYGMITNREIEPPEVLARAALA
ncbi:MAG: hypothetical protein R3F11_06610 [Verrucomicrobiales bacterium]